MNKICFYAPFVSGGYATGHFTPPHKAEGNRSLCQATNSPHHGPAFSSLPFYIFSPNNFCKIFIWLILWVISPQTVKWKLSFHVIVLYIFGSLNNKTNFTKLTYKWSQKSK